MPDTRDAFLEAYLECALWCGFIDDKDNSAHDMTDIAAETLERIRKECAAFVTYNADDIADRLASAGHDFYLTRNHHGAGFWDGDWPGDAGQRLTENAHAYGSQDLYVGDDGRVYAT
jgi:hypothetical protein